MIRRELADLIKQTTKDANLDGVDFGVEQPEDKTHGDYATNIALKLARTFKMPPMKIAENLKPRILQLGMGLLEKVEIMEPGFINFFISKKYLQNQVEEILEQKDKFGRLKIGEDKKVNIESISANPTGQLHIGNGRNAFAGDALANVLERAGYKVTREYYINNAKNSKQIIELGRTVLGKGEVYFTEYLKSKIQNPKSKNKIKNSKMTEGDAGFLLAGEVQADTKQFLEKKLNIKFDKWVSEEDDLYKKNKIKKIFEWLKNNDLVYEKDRAFWLKTSQFGDEKDWVVIRETGEPTYLLSDIAYHKDKFDRGFDVVIDIWGADHQAHVSKMKSVAKMLGFKGNLDIMVLQLVTLRGGEKMSKRAGNIITLEELVDEIGLDAARWFYLQKSLDTHTEIDLELAKEQSEKNPVFYVQYAYARICSILEKSKSKNKKIKNLELLKHHSELDLVKQLIRFPEVIEDTAIDYQVQRLPQYAASLAAAFHQFYHDCKVLTETEELQQARLNLLLATQVVLKDVLSLMGISAPEKM